MFARRKLRFAAVPNRRWTLPSVALAAALVISACNSPSRDDCICCKSDRNTSVAKCACGCGGTPRPICAHRDCVCAQTKVVTEAGVKAIIAACPCGCGGTPRPYCAHRACVCAKTKTNGEPAAQPYRDYLLENMADQ